MEIAKNLWNVHGSIDTCHIEFMTSSPLSLSMMSAPTLCSFDFIRMPANRVPARREMRVLCSMWEEEV